MVPKETLVYDCMSLEISGKQHMKLFIVVTSDGGTWEDETEEDFNFPSLMFHTV